MTKSTYCRTQMWETYLKPKLAHHAHSHPSQFDHSYMLVALHHSCTPHFTDSKFMWPKSMPNSMYCQTIHGDWNTWSVISVSAKFQAQTLCCLHKSQNAAEQNLLVKGLSSTDSKIHKLCAIYNTAIPSTEILSWSKLFFVSQRKTWIMELCVLYWNSLTDKNFYSLN